MSNNLVKPGLFRRIFILYAVILAVAVVFIEFYITNTVRESTVRELEHDLAIQGRLIAKTIPFHTPSALDNICREIKQDTGARVTVIANDGTVIGDSDHDSKSMDNHAHRQEVQQASLNSVGTAVRFSDTLKYDLLYVAVRAGRGESSPGFVRLSLPLREVDAGINLLRIRILTVVFGILFAAALFSVGQIEHIRRLTRQIRDFSASLAAGQVGKKLFLQKEGEFDEIAESLNAMSDELRKSITSHEEEKQRLNMILRNIPDALFIIDAKGTIALSSVAARKLFGETALQGRRFIEVVRNSEFLALVEKVRCEEKTASAEIKLDTPLEQYCVVQVSPLFYAERELSGYIAIFHDITQLMKLEQTRKDFVANISHEIRTPITAIQGFADTLLDGALDDRDHALKFLQTIKTNSERINSLVEDLLTISKLELGVITVEKTTVNLSAVVDDVLAMLRDRAAAKNLFLNSTIPPDAAPVEADRDRLIQIFSNLADNGIKFTDKGGVTIREGRENGTRCLYIEDTGIGIAQKHLSRLGERFYRADPGRSRSMGGTGLGLAIVKHLVKAHGWDMQVQSTPGKGTTVKILLY
jgi:two-component system, OmpR family, phosphate regulon sensor histidine kinase PhoR